MITYKLLIRLGAIVLLFVVVLGIYMFWYGQVTAKSARVANLAGQIQQESSATSRQAQAQSELVMLQSYQQSINQYFLSTTNVVPFLQNLQTTGTYFGSSVDVASVSANPGTPYGYLNLSLKVTGSFNAVMRTIGAIEYQPYDTSIESLTFDTPQTPDSSSAQVWTATMQVRVGTQQSSTSTSTAATSTSPIV